MSKFLDEKGLVYFWQLAKDYIDGAIPKLISLLTNDRGFITTATDLLVHYYTTLLTYSKLEILELLNTAADFDYVIVDSLPAASASTKGKFYLYDGHRWITQGDDPYEWVDLGTYDVNLDGYVSEAGLNLALTNRPVFQETDETSMQNLIDEGTYIPGVLYYSVED